MRKDKHPEPVEADELARLTEDLERRNAALVSRLQEQDRNRAALLHLLDELEHERNQIEQGRREWVTALDAVQDPIFIHDKDMKVVRANRAYAARAGMDVREVIGRFYWELFPKLDAPLASCKRAIEERQSAEEEFRLPTGEGFVSRAYPVHDGEGRYLYSLHVLENVTEKRKAEAEQRVLSEAMRQAAEAVLVLDAEARIAYLNPAFYRLFGYAPGEILGKPIMSLSVPGADAALQPAAVVAALREHGQWKGEVRRRARDGTAIPVLLSASVIRDDKSEIAGYVGTFLDLRDIRRAEAAARDAEQKFRNIFEAALDGILLADMQTGRFLTGNPAICRMLGYSAEEIARLGVSDIHSERDLPHAMEQFEKQTRGEIELAADIPVRRKDGSVFYADIKSAPVRLGGKACLMGIFRDITARKQAEDALRRSNRALKTLSAANAALVHAQSESELLRQICRAVVETGGYAYAWIGYAMNDPEKRIRPMAQEGFEPGFLESQSWSTQGQDPCSTAVREGVAVIARGADNDPVPAERRDVIARLGIDSIASFPLLSGNEAFGMLSIYSRERDAFDRDELMLLAEMAEDLNFGIVTLRARAAHEELQQAHLAGAERLKETLTDTIRAIALTVEKRDPYTAGHQSKVAELCVAIGKELGLAGDVLEGLRLGAMIHDIGKVYVPAEILNRPGKLTPAEFEIIKAHPEVGYDIVKDIKFPWPVGKMILQHHERLDGSGYPKGLKGEEIVQEARILAVADTVEAMSAHRPYRPARGIEAGLAEITQRRGTYYDPRVVDACLKVIQAGFTFQDDKT